MSLLPQMKSVDDDKKPMLYVELINAVQRVKNQDNKSAVIPNQLTYSYSKSLSEPVINPVTSINPVMQSTYQFNGFNYTNI
ncbi:BESS domain-containing protein [Aphis craccivora]|uniref:BESS domain-containing protein n=1 Tax=Aphis craccivora TaxID=307492 RepID=A0A6G0VUS8_APHCR|nr:BESS domain-containing protein [Aphis craccivora]